MTCVIFGAKRMEQLDDNLPAPELRLLVLEIGRLGQVSILAPAYPGRMLKGKRDGRVQI